MGCILAPPRGWAFLSLRAGCRLTKCWGNSCQGAGRRWIGPGYWRERKYKVS